MADRGRYTPVEILKRIAALARIGRPKAEVAREVNVDWKTVDKYWPPDVKSQPPGRPPQDGADRLVSVAPEWAFP